MAQAVLGVVEIVAGVILDVASYDTLSFIGNPLIAAGSATLLGYAASLLLNPHRQTLVPIGASYVGTLEGPAKTPETIEDVAAIYLAPRE
jgi:hypothetical protein